MAIESKPDQASVADLLHHIGHDLKMIATYELKLAHHKLSDSLEALLLRAGVALVAAFVAVTGLAMLCIAAVPVLEPLVSPLWLRLLIMALIYITLGVIAVMILARRAAARSPTFDDEVAELKRTVHAVERGLEH